MILHRLGILLALIVMVSGFSSAQATSTPSTYTISLLSPVTSKAGTGTSCAGYACGNSLGYLVGTGNNVLGVRATAWSINTTTNPDVVTNAFLGRYTGYGLGVSNRSESSGSPEHSIDNSNAWIDFVMFQFDRAVDLNSFDIGWVYGAGSDADATIRWGDVGVHWKTSPAIHNKPITTLDALISGSADSNVNSAATGTRFVNPTNIFAKTWIISSRSSAGNTGIDYFKLKSLSVNAYPPVPEPSTWLTMILGFGLIGWSARRRRTAKPSAAEGAA